MDRVCSTPREKRSIYRVLVGKPGQTPVGGGGCCEDGMALSDSVNCCEILE
jgi:hypothetical protein